MRALSFAHLAVLAAAAIAPENREHTVSRDCPGNINIDGYGITQLVPSSYVSPTTNATMQVRGGEVVPEPNSRGYFGRSCKKGEYRIEQYLTLNLLGHQLSVTIDLTGAGCGCNFAFYLTSMGQNDVDAESKCGDYYCDANNICGASCSEIDIMEANQHAWHSTLHGKHDHSGFGMGYGGGGYGWNGPRDWNGADYGPGGRCVDTTLPFQLEAAFPMNDKCEFAGMEVTLWQAGKPCKLNLELSNYPAGMQELHDALKAGMVPVVSYWTSDNLAWLDGSGSDRQGPCAVDTPDKCQSKVTLSNFSIHKLHNEQQECPEQVLTDEPPGLMPTQMPPSKPPSDVQTEAETTSTPVANRARATEGMRKPEAQMVQPIPPKLPTRARIAYTENDWWLAVIACLAVVAVLIACIWLLVAVVPALQPQPSVLLMPREQSDLSHVSPVPDRVPNTMLQKQYRATGPAHLASMPEHPQPPVHTTGATLDG